MPRSLLQYKIAFTVPCDVSREEYNVTIIGDTRIKPVTHVISVHNISDERSIEFKVISGQLLKPSKVLINVPTSALSYEEDFVDSVDNVIAKFYRIAQVFALPIIHEPFRVKALEDATLFLEDNRGHTSLIYIRADLMGADDSAVEIHEKDHV